MNTFSNQVTRALSDIGIERPEGVDFLTLHDIFRLMPKIGEKMGWTQYVKCVDGKEHGYPPLGNGKYSDTCRWCKVKFKMPPDLHELTESFLSGDYPACETVLLDLLKEHE